MTSSCTGSRAGREGRLWAEQPLVEAARGGRRSPRPSPPPLPCSRRLHRNRAACCMYLAHTGKEICWLDTEDADYPLKLLWNHINVILCCSLEPAPTFTFGNNMVLEPGYAGDGGGEPAGHRVGGDPGR